MTRDLRRDIADFHRIASGAVEVFADDEELYEARRTARKHREASHRRAARRPPLRVRWAQASWIERFSWIVWWALCAVFGAGFGAAVVTFVYFAF